MKTLEQILDVIESKGISIDKYTEDNKLCGYELNTYTNGGVNQIIFVDFRNSDYDPTDATDFLMVITERINTIDIDDEIETNRLDESYKATFTLRQSLEDFTEWKETLDEILNEINSETIIIDNDEIKKSISSMLVAICSNIGIDRPSNFDDILEFCYNDVIETADLENWHSGDVAIAFRRWIEAQATEIDS